MVPLEELLGDVDAVSTCNRLVSCYKEDTGTNVLEGLSSDCSSASLSFIHQISGKPLGHVKATLDNLNHALLIVNSLCHKAVLNNTSDIINSLDEANIFLQQLSDISESVDKMQTDLYNRYHGLISLYKSLDRDIVCLERICKAQSYVVECMEVLLCLSKLKTDAQNFAVSLDGLSTLLNTAKAAENLILRVNKMDNSELHSIIEKKCEDFKAYVVRIAFEKAIMPLFDKGEMQPGDHQGSIQIMIICHYIFRELDVAPSLTLRLVDEIVAATSRCMDLHMIIEATSQNNWQHLFLSQFSDFMSKYGSCLNSLYTFCRSVNYRMEDHLDDKDVYILKTCKILSQPLPAEHDPLELFAACELYAKRSVGVLRNVLEHLEGVSTSDGRIEMYMFAPQLISVGESIHNAIRHLTIPFNLHSHYFQNICERYAKQFMVNAAERIIPISKTLYSNCIKVLNTHNVHSWADLSADREVQLASMLVNELPNDLEVAHTINQFLQMSSCCDTLHRHVLQIANSAMKNIADASIRVTTSRGSHLMLNDGGSKISLKRPNEAQAMNAKVYHYIMSIVSIIDPCLVTQLDRESQLFNTVNVCKGLQIIDNWADDVGVTLWHTVSYISSGNCQEFSWQVNQVLTATQHIVKICNFLCENYFNPLVPGPRMNLFRRLATHAISAFIIYALTVWPIDEEDKISLVNIVTELEMALAEILKESLPKLEAEYLSSFRRLVFLGDEELNAFSSPDFRTELCVWLPEDVISLHLMARILNNNNLTKESRNDIAKRPLYQHLGTSSPHLMLEMFRDSLLIYDPAAMSLPLFGSKFVEYLQQFSFYNELSTLHMKDAIKFLNSH